jgi:hypothetical protein
MSAVVDDQDFLSQITSGAVLIYVNVNRSISRIAAVILRRPRRPADSIDGDRLAG